MKQLWKMLLPMRGLAIMLVVLGHSSSILLGHDARVLGDGIIALTVGESWSLASPLLTICLELARTAVPLFLFLSGHYLSHTLPTRHGLWTSLTKIIYPMVLWSLVAWAVSYRLVEGGWSIDQFLLLFVKGEAQLGYYFLILILQYYLLAPWLVAMVKRWPRASLVGAGLIQLLVQLYNYACAYGGHGGVPNIEFFESLSPLPECLFPRFLFFVVLGIWAGLHPDPLRRFVSARLSRFAIAALISLALLVSESGHMFHAFHIEQELPLGTAISRAVAPWKLTTTLWSICSILFLLALSCRRVPGENWLNKLGPDAYMIFILHGMVVTVVEALFVRYQPPSYCNGAGGLLVLLLVGLFTPIVVGRFLRSRMRNRLHRRVILGD